MSKLALYGGTPVLNAKEVPEEMFHWPIVNDAMRQAQAEVLETGNMSGTDISRKFEKQFAEWHGVKYGLAHNTGTNALLAAMYGIGLGPGDELICPSVTYWASCTGALALGASVVFCDIDPDSFTMDPSRIEPLVTDRTVAILPIHVYSPLIIVTISESYVNDFSSLSSDRGVALFKML